MLSPLINVMSGVPYRFVIFAKLPTSKVDTPALTVLKSLALLISLIVGAIFSISNPLIYALPGLTCKASKESLAVLPSSVDAPEAYSPVKSSFPTEVSTLSFATN